MKMVLRAIANFATNRTFFFNTLIHCRTLFLIIGSAPPLLHLFVRMHCTGQQQIVDAQLMKQAGTNIADRLFVLIISHSQD